MDAAILFGDLLLPLAPLGIPFDFAGRRGARSSTSRSAAPPTSTRCAASSRARSWASCSRRSACCAASSTRAADRLRRRAVHARELRDRGRALDDFALHQAADVRASPRPGTAWPRCWPTWCATTCARRSRPARRRCSSSTPGSARWTQADYREFVLPHVRAIFAGLRGPGVPVIHFGTGTGHLLELQREAGGDVIGVDWRTPLDEGWTRAGDGVGDPGQPRPARAARAARAPAGARGRRAARARAAAPGHVFNLGHGILPGDAGRERAGGGRARARDDRSRVTRRRRPDARRVVVVGGGIAGLTAAHALQRGAACRSCCSRRPRAGAA